MLRTKVKMLLPLLRDALLEVDVTAVRANPGNEISTQHSGHLVAVAVQHQLSVDPGGQELPAVSTLIAVTTKQCNGHLE